MNLKTLRIICILCGLGTLSFVLSTVFANELIEEAFMPAKSEQAIIDLGNTKDAVGNEILRQSVGLKEDVGFGCFLNQGKGPKIDGEEIKKQACEVKYGGTFKMISVTSLSVNECVLPDGSTRNIDNNEKKDFCTTLGGDRNVGAIATQAPLIVRITKFLLRLTVVLSITMVIYTGIMYIVEASKGAEVKEASQNLMYIVGGLLLALMSVALINLISSLSISSLGIQ